MPKEATLMECGHTAQAVDSKGNPCCVICVLITPELDKKARTPATPPDLTGRFARCSYDRPGSGGGGKYRKHEDGDSIRPTTLSLAFLELKPDAQWDDYYCGCWGWD
jgi:hypothetical protein